MTRIVFVTDYLTTITGGSRFLLEVFKKLTKDKNNEVYIVAGATHEYENLHANSRLHVINLNSFKMNILPSDQPVNAMRFLLKASKIAKELVKELRPCIVHLNSHFQNLIPYIIRLGTPTVCSIHHLEETAQFHSITSKIAKVIIQDLLEVNVPCTVIHVPSNYTRQKILRLRLLGKPSIVVIPPGIELERYTSIPRRPENDLFVMIGRLEKRKHYDHAIATFKIFVKYRPEAKLVIVGDGPLKEKLHMLIERLGLQNTVRLLGAVPEKEKLDILSRAQALIHLGYPEGFGIVLIEALATGVPVITYDIPPMNEIIINKVHGILVKKDNIMELVNALININNLNFHREVLISQAKKYDIKLIAKKFDSLYKKLLQVT